MEISREVKVWRRPGITYQQPGEKPFKKKEGPYINLSKSESSELSRNIKAQIDFLVNWEKPDYILDVNPKWNEEVQYCKCTG